MDSVEFEPLLLLLLGMVCGYCAGAILYLLLRK